jgi:hypothetical protein
MNVIMLCDELENLSLCVIKESLIQYLQSFYPWAWQKKIYYSKFIVYDRNMPIKVKKQVIYTNESVPNDVKAKSCKKILLSFKGYFI